MGLLEGNVPPYAAPYDMIYDTFISPNREIQTAWVLLVLDTMFISLDYAIE
jgi:hypothetical protein